MGFELKATTDIVERLRDIMESGIRPIPPELVLDAADEIMWCYNEIERLRADLAGRDKVSDRLAEENEEFQWEQEEEIARLRADLAYLDKVCEAYAEQNQRFHEEIERLRAALHWTAQSCLDQNCVHRAMVALKGRS